MEVASSENDWSAQIKNKMKNNIFIKTFALLSLCGVTLGTANGSLVTLNLLDPSGIGLTAGEAFEASGFFVTSGVTFTVGAATTLGDPPATAPFNAVFSANAASAGINSTDTSSDEASELDSGETLTFTLTFLEAVYNVSLVSADLRLVGSDASDAALVSTPDGSVSLYDGQPDFTSGSNLWTPAGGISFGSGEAIVFEATNSYALQALTFDITPIPELVSPAVLSLFLIIPSMFYRRRVRRSDVSQSV